MLLYSSSENKAVEFASGRVEENQLHLRGVDGWQFTELYPTKELAAEALRRIYEAQKHGLTAYSIPTDEFEGDPLE